MPAFRHVVLFHLHEGADPEPALRVLRDACPETGVLTWTVTRSLDQRKGIVVVEDATFVEREAFEDFRASDGHQAAVAHMSQCSDWVVGDWWD